MVHRLGPLVIILDFSSQDLDSLVLGIQLLVKPHLRFSEPGHVLVVLVTDIFLVDHQLLLVLDLLPQIEVGLVLDVGSLSEFSELGCINGYILLNLSNGVENSDLFELSLLIFSFDLAELSDKAVNFDPVLADFGEALVFNALFLKLHLLVLILQVPELVPQGADISLSILKVGDFLLQLGDEELLVLRDPLSRLLDDRRVLDM